MKDDITLDFEADSDETKTESAVRRLTPLFDLYKSQAGGSEDEQTHFSDLLADLMHFAHATREDEEYAIDFDAALSTAQLHFSHEVDDEDEDDQDDEDDEDDLPPNAGSAD